MFRTAVVGLQVATPIVSDCAGAPCNRRVARSAVPFVAISVLVAACQDASSPQAPLEISAPARNAIAPMPPAIVRPGEQEFLSVSAEVSSFAGYYFDADGNLVVRSKGRAAEAALRARMTAVLRREEPVFRARGLAARGVVVADADFTFAELAAWRDVVTANLFDDKRVVTSDVDEERNRVVVEVRRDAFGSVVEAARLRLTQLGVPAAAVLFEPTGGVVRTQIVGATLLDQWRPIPGGVNTQVRQANGGYLNPGCSTGAVLQFDGSYYLTTAAHCSSTPFQLDYGEISQEAVSAFMAAFPNTIGTEIWDRSPYGANYLGLPYRRSDVSLYTTGPGLLAFGKIARTTGDRSTTTNSPAYYNIVATEQGITTGTIVWKTGITTGFTWGKVTRSCIDVNNPDMAFGFMSCQFAGDYWSLGGDSGGPIYQVLGDPSVRLLGAVWGRNNDNGWGYFSGYRGIEFDLVGAFDTGRLRAY